MSIKLALKDFRYRINNPFHISRSAGQLQSQSVVKMAMIWNDLTENFKIDIVSDSEYEMTNGCYVCPLLLLKATNCPLEISNSNYLEPKMNNGD